MTDHQEMVIDLRDEDAQQTVTVSGEVDISTAPALHRRLATALAGNAQAIALDLSAVTFIDSSAMGVILNAHKKAAHLGKALAIRLPEGRARFPFEVTGLAAIFAREVDVVASEPAG